MRNIDTVIGRVKEALGALTGNKRLKDDGRIDQAKGSVVQAQTTLAACTPATWLHCNGGYMRVVCLSDGR